MSRLTGTKYIVGDGPDIELLKKIPRRDLYRLQAGRGTGAMFDNSGCVRISEPDRYLWSGDVGSHGCSLAVVALPVTGPVDVMKQNITGYLDENLQIAVENALKLNPQDCIDFAKANTWRKCAESFFAFLAPDSPLLNLRVVF